MGRAMAGHLLASGWRVAGFDVDARANRALARLGGEVAASPRRLAAFTDGPLVVAVRDAPQAEQVVLGPDGIAAAGYPTLVIVVSTVGPTAIRHLAARTPAELRILDAPVSGGPARAADGSLTMMVAGPEPHQRDARALLDAVSDHVVVAGNEVGAAQAAKLVNQVVLGATVAAVADGLRLGTALGVPESAALEVLASGTARSWVTANWPRLARYWDPQGDRGSLDLVPRDVQLALDELAAAGPRPSSVPVVTAALEQLVAARSVPVPRDA
jgi:3-hydroxyisobutyrate dehydrogenase-like beta-hydroxyacid dehydrogenase